MATTKCMHPFMTKKGLAVCGHCPNCRKRLASSWSFRLMQEDRNSDCSYFLTFTYADACYITRNGFLSLSPKHRGHLQNFFKVVRERYFRQRGQRASFKYFAVGEYGGISWRPHYHVLLFGLELEYLFDRENLLALKLTDYDGKCTVDCLHWDYGHVTVGRVTVASVGYCCKYMLKAPRVPQHRNDDRISEYRMMSKGLGESYLGETMRVWCGAYVDDPLDGRIIEIKRRSIVVKPSASFEWHRNFVKDRMFCNVPGDVKVSMPRYYKDKLYDIDEKLLINEHLKANAKVSNVSLRDRFEAMEASKRNVSNHFVKTKI